MELIKGGIWRIAITDPTEEIKIPKYVLRRDVG